MAVIDPRSDAVVIRVVYDGPPMAGKTTSVRALARGLGAPVVAPEEIDGRTLFFDWLDYTGGLFEGRRIRCQIVSVPGQATLASRRRRLVESADVVVFVGDSAPQEQLATQSYLEGLRSVLDGREGPPIGIVLQANKRDRPEAVSLDVLRALAERAGGRIAVVESVATEGTGIREAFVFAVRLALDRVRELMRVGRLPNAPPAIDSAPDLLAQLQNHDGASLELAASGGLRHTRLHEVQESGWATRALEQVVRENTSAPPRASIWAAAPAAEAVAEKSASLQAAVATPSRDDASTGVEPWVPTGDLPSGMIWPPVNGRLVLHRATSAPVRLRRQVNGDWVGTAGDWHMHSPADARFDQLAHGHGALVNWARMHAASAHVISNERCIVLCNDGTGHFRLWQIVKLERSLRDQLDADLRSGPQATAKSLLALTRAFLLAAERFASAACWLPLNLRNVGALPGGSRYLGHMPDPARSRPAEPRLPGATMKLLTVQLQYALPELQACRSDALAVLDAMIQGERGTPQDPTHGFVRRFLDAVSL